jgi:CheY-like chemotaxis protein
MTSNSQPTSPQIEILLVEDDLADIKMTQRTLSRERFVNRLHIARDGVEAMQFLRREGSFADVPRPDLLLLDLNMPRKDGREVLREVKADPALKSIPVVILTTSAADRDVKHCYLENANSYVTKPVDMAQFREVVLSVTQYWFAVVKLPPK